MTLRHLARPALGLALAVVAARGAATAEPLLTGGIGLQSCAKLGPELKPSEGLNHPPNYLLFYWVQGYMSAANIYLLNEYTDYIDMATLDDKTIVQVVADFCKENPGDKPISAIDKYIREAKKVEAKESDAFDPWEH
jgi:hypothetical protein